MQRGIIAVPAETVDDEITKLRGFLSANNCTKGVTKKVRGEINNLTALAKKATDGAVPMNKKYFKTIQGLASNPKKFLKKRW